MTAIPAAPRPMISTFRSSRRRPVSLTAFSSAAITTTAVPCWSSWKTGMSSCSFSRSSISKQRGAEMSSRLMPPNAGAISLTVRTISSVSVVSRQIGKASTPANSLNRQHLPSITGIAAARADVAEPEHRGAVGDDRDRVALDRVLEGLVRVVGDRQAHARDARACRPSRGRRGSSAGACCAVRSCRPRAAGTCGRWCRSPRRPSSASIAARIRSQCSRPEASTTMSRRLWPPSTSTRSTAPTMPAGFADRARHAPERCPGRRRS